MAFGLLGTIGTANSKSADQTSLVLTTTQNLEAGNVGILIIAVDNHQTTNGDEGAVSGVIDAVLNEWNKAKEFTNGQGSAQGGATCSMWYTKAASQLVAGSTITISFTNSTSRDASAATTLKFSVGAGSSIAVDATNQAADDAEKDPSTLDVTTSNAERLRIRGIAVEHQPKTFTATTGWTAFPRAASSGGSDTSNQIAWGESRIITATGAASSPVASAGSADIASCYVAFREVASDISMTGSLSMTGALSLQVSKGFSGDLTPTGTLINNVSTSMSGALTTQGTLIKQPGKIFAGTLTSAGSLLKQAQVVLSGTLTTEGTLEIFKTTLLNLEGTLTTAGNLTKQVSTQLIGTLSTQGTLIQQVNKIFSGTLTTSGSLIKQVATLFTGTLSTSGAIDFVKVTLVTFTGTLTTAGDLVKRDVLKYTSGTLGLAGNLMSRVSQFFGGTLGLAGSLSKSLSKLFGGTLSLGGIASFIKSLIPAPELCPPLDIELVNVQYDIMITGALTSGALVTSGTDAVVSQYTTSVEVNCG